MAFESYLASMTVPKLVTDAADRADGPSGIFQANEIPLRVLVRNTSVGGSVFLSFNGAALTSTPLPNAMVYELPAGAADVFVIDVGQRLMVMSGSTDATISYAVSRALPEDGKAK